MLLYFMRHGDAENGNGQPDAARRLTEKGLQRTRDTARVLGRLGVQPQVILTSPLVRARQTAEIVGETLGVAVVEERVLGAGCNLVGLAEALEAHNVSGPAMVVGHEPDFSSMVGELIGLGQVEMRKGAVACVSVHGIARSGGVLVWLMSGKDLAALA